jgi:hypothetical protein
LAYIFKKTFPPLLTFSFLSITCRFVRVTDNPLVLSVFAACSTEQGDLKPPQHVIDVVKPLLLIGRLFVYQQLNSFHIDRLQEEQEQGGRLSPEAKEEWDRRRKECEDLFMYVNAHDTNDHGQMPLFAYLQNAANLINTIQQ